jgi:hypothetical protein
MKPNHLRSTTLVLAVLVALTAPACVPRGQPILNPRYKTTPIPGPAAVVTLDCSHVDRGTRNGRQRELFAATVPDELWRAVGLAGEPRFEATRYTDPLCEELVAGADTVHPGYAINARLRKAVEQRLAGRPDASLLVISSFFPYACDEETATVRDHNGVAVGSIGTGKELCGETAEVWLHATLLTPTEIVWSSSAASASEDYADAAAIAARLFEAFPREVLAAR